MTFQANSMRLLIPTVRMFASPCFPFVTLNLFSKATMYISHERESRRHEAWAPIRPIFPIIPIFRKTTYIFPIIQSNFLFYLYFTENFENNANYRYFAYFLVPINERHFDQVEFSNIIWKTLFIRMNHVISVSNRKSSFQKLII